mmetsp:Transcript_2558/g.3462  ORF Transcript_2558/g.3462 Transcript_2558/m.3462 type:complete len:249 (+) Transcript_2558:117-863(+)
MRISANGILATLLVIWLWAGYTVRADQLVPGVSTFLKEDSTQKFYIEVKDDQAVLTESQYHDLREALVRWPVAEESLIEIHKGPHKLKDLYWEAKRLLKSQKLMVTILIDDASQQAAIVYSSRTDPTCMQKHISGVVSRSDKGHFYSAFVDVLEDLPRVVRETQCHIPFDNHEITPGFWWLSRLVMTAIVIGIGTLMCDPNYHHAIANSITNSISSSQAGDDSAKGDSKGSGLNLRDVIAKALLPDLH